MSLISSHATAGGAAAERKSRVHKDEGESGPLNMKEGTRVFAKFRDGLERKASVIERKLIKKEDGATVQKYRYYVHWIDLNRRMDSWVHGDDVRYDAESDEVAKKARAEAASAAAPATASGETGGRGKSAGRNGGKSGGGAVAAATSNHASHAIAEGDIVDSDGTVLKTKRKVRICVIALDNQFTQRWLFFFPG